MSQLWLKGILEPVDVEVVGVINIPGHRGPPDWASYQIISGAGAKEGKIPGVKIKKRRLFGKIMVLS